MLAWDLDQQVETTLASPTESIDPWWDKSALPSPSRCKKARQNAPMFFILNSSNSGKISQSITDVWYMSRVVKMTSKMKTVSMPMPALVCRLMEWWERSELNTDHCTIEIYWSMYWYCGWMPTYYNNRKMCQVKSGVLHRPTPLPNLQLPSAGHLAGQPGKAFMVIQDQDFIQFMVITCRIYLVCSYNFSHLIVQNTLFKSKAEKIMTAHFLCDHIRHRWFLWLWVGRHLYS